MATIIVCDGGCGAQSPDTTLRSGQHVANHWLRVRASSNHDFERKGKYDDLLFCRVCSPRVLAAMEPKDTPHV